MAVDYAKQYDLALDSINDSLQEVYRTVEQIANNMSKAGMNVDDAVRALSGVPRKMYSSKEPVMPTPKDRSARYCLLTLDNWKDRYFSHTLVSSIRYILTDCYRPDKGWCVAQGGWFKYWLQQDGELVALDKPFRFEDTRDYAIAKYGQGNEQSYTFEVRKTNGLSEAKAVNDVELLALAKKSESEGSILWKYYTMME